MRYVVGALCAIASAGGIADDWPYTRATCDGKTQVVVVEEALAKTEAAIPSGRGIQRLDALTEIKTIEGPAGDQDYQVKKREFWSRCNVGGAAYKIRVSPWKFNAKLDGMCGGYSPSTELTVWRNGSRLLGPLVFSGYCDPPDSDYFIQAVRIRERDRNVSFSLVAGSGPYQKVVDFGGVGALKRAELAPERQ